MMGHCQPRHVVLSLLMLALAALACSLQNASNTDTTAKSVQTRPLVLILAPANGSLYAEGVEIQFHAIAQDSLSGVTRIEFRVDDVPVGEVKSDNPNGQSSLEAQIKWVAADRRGHVLTVEAFRSNGSSLGLADVTLKVTDKPIAQLPGGSGLAAPPTFTPGAGVQSAPATSVPTPTQSALLSPSLTPLADQGILAGPVARSTVNGLKIRQGPGTTYNEVGMLAQNERVSIVGHSADGLWWAVSYRGGTAWVFAQLVAVEGDTSQVPLVAAP